MFGFPYLIAEDVLQEREKFVNLMLNIITISFFTIVLLHVYIFIAIYPMPALTQTFILLIWNSLTPGHEWLELLTILTSVATFSFSMWLFIDIVDRMDNHWTELKKELQEKNNQLKQLESRNQ